MTTTRAPIASRPAVARTGRVVGGGAAVTALAAAFGAAGLAFGFNPLPAGIERRLPLHSPVIGGLALALIVALPYTVLATMAWRGDRRWPVASLGCGFVLIGWIAVELVFVRELSFLHPLCAAAGTAFASVGWRSMSHARQAS